MSKVAFLGNRPLDRVRHCFEQDGVEFARVAVGDREPVEAPVVSFTKVDFTGASVVKGVAGQGKSASLARYFERALEEAGTRPDVWVLDVAALFALAQESEVGSQETPAGEILAHFYHERTPLLFLIDHLDSWGVLRSFLSSGVADYVRLSTFKKEEDSDLNEDDSQEVCERVQLLLDRFDEREARTEERPLTDTQRLLMAPVRTLTELHNPKSGRLDAVQIANFYGLSQAALGRIKNFSRARINKTSDAPALQEALQPWSYVAGALEELVGSREAARVWLNTPNPLLEDHTPLSLMQGGEAEVVASVLRNALMGQPA